MKLWVFSISVSALGASEESLLVRQEHFRVREVFKKELVKSIEFDERPSMRVGRWLFDSEEAMAVE